MIPGDDVTFAEGDLFYRIGRLTVLLELEQTKRIALVKAYSDLKADHDALKYSTGMYPEDVVIGNP